MAAPDAPHGEPRTAQGTVVVERLQRIRRTRGGEAARARPELRHPAVQPHEGKEQRFHDVDAPVATLRLTAAASSGQEAVSAAARPTTT